MGQIINNYMDQIENKWIKNIFYFYLYILSLYVTLIQFGLYTTVITPTSGAIMPTDNKDQIENDFMNRDY